MTLISSISKLTTSVDKLAGDANVTKAQLDTKVALAEADVLSAQAEQAATKGYRDAAAAHAADAANHLATVKTGVTYQGISAVLAEKAVTAMDVLVYDTSLDSDGGAWRKRCQHTSWYNEPLNSATRGARREFPAVAVIVAEPGKFTIYDGDDPALPMWMVFNLNNQDQVSIAALNGIVLLGNKWVANAVYGGNGLNILDFVADRWRLALKNGSVPWLVPEMPCIKSGNMTTWFATTTSGPKQFYPLVDYTVNAVAMTVLHDAPVDATTGLPVPTIAVGCGVTGQPNGGTSIIKHAGSVIDIVASGGAGGYACFDLGFGRDGQLVTTQSYNRSYGYVHIFDELPYADIPATTTPSGARTYSYGIGYPSVRGTLLGSPIINGMEIDGDVVSFALSDKLSYLLDDGATKAKTMVAYTVSQYTSGWLVGDMKGAWLASADSAALSDVNLLPSDILKSDAGWTLKSNTTVSGGLLTIDPASDGSWYGNAKFPFQIEAGKAYRLVVTVDSMAPGNDQLWIYLGGGGILVDAVSVSAPGTYEILHIASKSASDITIEDRHNTATTFVVSQFELYEADADRSVNAASLIVNGTITRSPVANGAELMAYSGFNDNNFLSRPYHSTLDFGTGDFSVIGWAKGGSLYDVILSYGDPASSGGLKISTDANLETIRLVVGNTTYTYGDGFRGANSGWWHFAVARQSGVVSLYVNGRLNRSFSAPSSVNGNGANKLQIAKSNLPFPTNAGSDVWTGSLALLRISATAPTLDQIRKIYEDERKLFMPGTQCTLYGTSDAVTALAHDPKTNLLHVGTSAGRSTFDGLVRVDNTETPITTAISAVGGMIAEQ